MSVATKALPLLDYAFYNPPALKTIPKGLGVPAVDQDFRRYAGQRYVPLNDAKKLNDASFGLTLREVTHVEKIIQHYLYPNLVADQSFTSINIGKGMENHTYWQWNRVGPPRPTISFEGRANVKTTKLEATVKLQGFDYDWHFTMPEIDAMNNPNRDQIFSESLEQGNLRELTNSLLYYRDYFIFRGRDIPNIPNSGQKGIVNNANITDPGAIGTGLDDNCTTAGDVYDSAVLMSSKLRTARNPGPFHPPYDVHMTPGLTAQAEKNRNATSDKTDMKLIMEHTDQKGTKVFRKIVQNPFLIASETETNTTGAIMVVAPGPENIRIVETYRLGFFAMPKISLGVDGKLLWKGGVELRRPTAVVYADDVTINTL